ncbi:MAG: YIP1 family protein [Pelagimonas sp.]|uniref:YIP1 family protein n=1 Tax=Pelagimonas sp. TaxID=2073170 RepID=UPI003D6BE439
MALSSDIVATYRGPGKVIARLLAIGPREDRALVFVMAAAFVMFVAQWPGLAREAHLGGEALVLAMGKTFVITVFGLPLGLYFVGFVTHWMARALGGQGTPFASRLALFWAFLAMSPLLLFYGLVAGFVGPGTQAELVKLLCWIVFLWFWFAGLRAVHKKDAG